MNLNINSTNLNVGQALRERIAHKLERVARHHSGIISVNITLSAEKNSHTAAAHIHLAGKDLHLETTDADLGAAIDVLMDKIDRAVIQHKEKSQNR